ncbi:GntR family transcriptional regulator [Desulfitobacterium sp. AusDCA]|uniref:GntR family transcriptional regulator n=1 Tax=Desulfitobacterium sp. AusDCA TaxID=3240383 RepID=UPI003DA78BA4
MELERKSGIPYYIQLKEQIRKNITKGMWQTGSKLPTERILAEELQVSRNTVGQAYKELEDEGVLTSTQGRGTFVADTIVIAQQESRKEKILRIIDVAMEDAVSLGFSINDFISFVHVRGMEKKELLAKLKVAFVECNPEQLAEARWNLGPGVTLIPVLLSELRERQGRERMKAMSMIVTGVNHLQKVKDLLEGLEQTILGISLQPKLETIVRIAKLPMERDIALICESRIFAEKVESALNNAGLFPKLKVLVKPREEEIQQLLPQCSAAILAPMMRKITERCRPEQMELIEFRFEPDTGSINLIRSTLLELKSKKDKL